MHQFLEYSLTFRTIFQQLNNKLFKNLINNNNANTTTNTTIAWTTTKIPFLFLTATFNLNLFQLLERFFRIKFNKSRDALWPDDPMNFSRRHITLCSKYNSRKLDFVKRSILSDKSLFDDSSRKIIIYSNQASIATKLKDQLEEWLDMFQNDSSNKLIGDCILVVGKLEKELKQACTESFTSECNLSTDRINEDTFYARILLATSSCIGAGLDSRLVKRVIRVGMPPSVLSFIQESGRCGRDLGSNDNIFDLSFCLDDFVYLLKRLYEQKYRVWISNNNDMNDNANNDAYYDSLMIEMNQMMI